jgi:hypothetical protein
MVKPINLCVCGEGCEGEETIPHVLVSVVVPHHLDVDPDSTYHPDADPDADSDSDF